MIEDFRSGFHHDPEAVVLADEIRHEDLYHRVRVHLADLVNRVRKVTCSTVEKVIPSHGSNYDMVQIHAASSGKGRRVSTAQKPHARVQRSPAIIIVAVP